LNFPRIAICDRGRAEQDRAEKKDAPRTAGAASCRMDATRDRAGGREANRRSHTIFPVLRTFTGPYTTRMKPEENRTALESSQRRLMSGK